MLSLRPLGGSVTTFRLRCRMPMGKRSVGSVVSHNRKSCMAQCQLHDKQVSLHTAYTLLANSKDEA